MISKNLFLTDLRENFKRRILSIVLCMLVIDFLYPVIVLMHINSLASPYGDGVIKTNRSLYEFVLVQGNCSGIMMVITLFAAVILAISGFKYLYDKEAIDFYASQPRTRKNRFFTVYMSGFAIFFVAAFIKFIESLIFMLLHNILTFNIFLFFGYGLFKTLLLFFAMYNLSILSVSLTGNMVTGVLGVLVFSFYEFIFRYDIVYICNSFFTTFISSDFFSDGAFWNSFTSPIVEAVNLSIILAKIYTLLYGGYAFHVMVKEEVPFMIGLFVMAIIYLLLAYIANKKRPMEGAGSAIVFERVKAPIKIALILISSVTLGLLFYDASTYSRFFMIVGLFIGAFIAHFICQTLYEGDVKAILRGKKSSAIGLSVSAAFVIAFYLGIMAYDRYVPKVSRVESVSVDLNMYERGHSISRTVEDDDPLGLHSDNEYLNDLLTYECSDKEAAIKLAKDCVNSLKNPGENNQYIRIAYILKNGRKVYREYYLDMDKYYDDVKAVFENEDYKKSVSFVRSEDAEYVASASKATCSDGFCEKTISQNRKLEILNAWIEDFEAMTFDDAIQKEPIAMLEYYDTENFKFSYYLPIIDSFDNTLNLLDEYGLLEYTESDIPYIFDIEVNSYDGSMVNITDEEMIKDIWDSGALNALGGDGFFYNFEDTGYTFHAYVITDGDDDTGYIYGYLDEDKLPADTLEYIKNNMF